MLLQYDTLIMLYAIELPKPNIHQTHTSNETRMNKKATNEPTDYFYDNLTFSLVKIHLHNTSRVCTHHKKYEVRC